MIDPKIQDQLNQINEALIQLRDHFEENGEVLFLAWHYSGGDKTRSNVISTTATQADYGSAALAWSGILDEHLRSDEEEDLPWKSN